MSVAFASIFLNVIGEKSTAFVGVKMADAFPVLAVLSVADGPFFAVAAAGAVAVDAHAGAVVADGRRQTRGSRRESHFDVFRFGKATTDLAEETHAASAAAATAGVTATASSAVDAFFSV